MSVEVIRSGRNRTLQVLFFGITPPYLKQNYDVLKPGKNYLKK